MKNIITILIVCIGMISCGTKKNKKMELTKEPVFTENTKNKVCVWAKVVSASDKIDATREELKKLLGPTRDEKGCKAYDLYEDVENAGVFYFHELWDCEQDLQVHLKNDHIKAFQNACQKNGLLAADLDISLWERNAYPVPNNKDLSSLVLFAKIVSKEGKESELQDALEGLIAPTRAEKGCIHYDLHKSITNANEFLFHETWATVPLWNDHMKNDHLEAFLGKVGILVDGDITITKAKVVLQ